MSRKRLLFLPACVPELQCAEHLRELVVQSIINKHMIDLQTFEAIISDCCVRQIDRQKKESEYNWTHLTSLTGALFLKKDGLLHIGMSGLIRWILTPIVTRHCFIVMPSILCLWQANVGSLGAHSFLATRKGQNSFPALIAAHTGDPQPRISRLGDILGMKFQNAKSKRRKSSVHRQDSCR